MIWAGHVPTKHFWAGRILKEFEEQLGDLAAAIEAGGAAALLVPSMAMDYDRRTPADLTPAGQGTYFARVAAVEAGLGTLGLNEMLLTPRFGARCFVGAVLTELDLPPDEPLVDDLCPGLAACGRCAAICPEQAIPLRAPEGAPLAAVRGLDEPACLRSSQPYGPDAFVDHVKRVFLAPTQAERIRQARGRTSVLMFHHMLVARQATYTGCMASEQVCPVGDDYPMLQRSPDRQLDLPDGVEHERADGWVTVRWVGPPVPYRPDYDA